MIAGCVYAGEYGSSDNQSFGWCFIVHWIGMIIVFGAGIISLKCGERKDEESDFAQVCSKEDGLITA